MGLVSRPNVFSQLPGMPAGGGLNRLLNLWLVFVIVLVIAARWATHDRAGPPPAELEPIVIKPGAAGWRGTWLEDKGPAVIRFDIDRGIYSPDGMAMLTFRPTTRGDEATFRVYLNGYPWILCLTKSGDIARLTGFRDAQTGTLPFVIASGGSTAERAAAEERRRADARSMLVPAEMGNFVRAGTATIPNRPAGAGSGAGR
jgi:hypothetical protein